MSVKFEGVFAILPLIQYFTDFKSPLVLPLEHLYPASSREVQRLQYDPFHSHVEWPHCRL